MFKKCLKYDLRAFGKIWLIAAGIMLALSLICALGFASFAFEITNLILTESNTDAEPDFMFYTNMFLGAICYFLILATVAVFSIGTNVVNYIRYYTHFFTDQGYLTFTLPVKRSTLFWSKATSGYMFCAGATLVTCVAIGIGIGGAMGGVLAGIIRGLILNGVNIWEIFELITWESICEFADLVWQFVLNDIGALNIFRVLFILLLSVLMLMATSFSGLMTGYFCITIGATLFRKLKLLGALVVYYVFNNVLAVPVAYLSSYYWMFAAMLGSTAIPKLFENLHIGMSTVYLALIIVILANISIGLIMAFFSIWRLDKKLNLA